MNKSGSSASFLFRPGLPAVLVFTGFFFLAGACGEKSRTISPKSLVPDTLMVAVITDIYLVEGVMIQLEYLQRRPQDAAIPYYDVVFRKHGITREQFRSSMEYYAQTEDQLDKIYDRVILNLGKHQLKPRKEGLKEKKKE